MENKKDRQHSMTNTVLLIDLKNSEIIIHIVYKYL